MAKYFKFIVESSTGDADNLLVDNLQYIFSESLSKLAFIPNDFNEGGVVKLTLNQDDPRGKVKFYLEEQLEILMNSNDIFREINLQALPLSQSVECASNTWAEWEVTAGFDPTDCSIILSATISPGGLGAITIGSAVSAEGITGWYATATGTPCGTQDIAFITGVDCGVAGEPVLGLTDYFFTGANVTCEGEEPVIYCLVAKKVYNTVGYTATLSFNKLTVPG